MIQSGVQECMASLKYSHSLPYAGISFPDLGVMGETANSGTITLWGKMHWAGGNCNSISLMNYLIYCKQ